MSVRIITGDCLAVLPTLDENSVDSIVTDPPYHLTTGKKGGSGPASVNLESPYGRARIGTGFMGMKWDGGDIAHKPETWAEILRVAKPGAYLLAFGGTRTFHRMACAIEDAGWELRDTLMWIYGSGFPKSKNLDGDRKGWGTALKPAWEPIIMARKPLIGTVAANVEVHGTGALNIDGCRIEPVGDGDYTFAPGDHGIDGRTRSSGFALSAGRLSAIGRWPANVVHDGSDEVLDAFPNAPGQQGDLTGHSRDRLSKHCYGDMKAARDASMRGDSGSAARFFYCAKTSREDRNIGCEMLAAKPLNWSSGTQSPGTFQAEGTNRSAANHHPTVKPTELMRWLVRLVTPTGGTVLDPFLGSGSTARACDIEQFDCIGIELNPEYVDIARRRIHGDAPLFTEVA